MSERQLPCSYSTAAASSKQQLPHNLPHKQTAAALHAATTLARYRSKQQKEEREKPGKKKLPVSVHSDSHYHVSCCCIGLLACKQQNGIYTSSCDR
jgi:hypothetical protein